MQTPWGDCPVLDAHVHFFSRPFFDALGAQCGNSAEDVAAAVGWTLPPASAAELAGQWVTELDKAGVAAAALIASIPGDQTSVRDAVAAFSSRFYAYAMVNPLAETATAALAVSPPLHAMCLFPAMHGFSMHDARVGALLEKAAAAARPPAIFVHCGVLTVGVRKKLGLPSRFDMRYSNPLDLHGVALAHPKLKFIVPHFGAGMFREALMLADLCPNVYLDTSSSNSWMRYEGLDLPTVFRRALAVAGARRLLFGTDSSFFPRGWNCEIFDVQARVLLNLGIAECDARLILGENLRGIFENR
ncbi:MAG TPA: amidohydrolase family protein [Bryobacteraceae bacterium]|nr:amidohydrolase family protein [Bryobacteraceae bacterium]